MIIDYMKHQAIFDIARLKSTSIKKLVYWVKITPAEV